MVAEISPSALDVQVPVIQIGKELGTSQHESKGRVNRRKEATGGKGAPLVNTTVGFDVGEEDSKCILCSVEPVYHLEKTAARCGSLYSMLCSMVRRETFWKTALRSRATRTRVGSASARYWMVLTVVLAPSCRLTP